MRKSRFIAMGAEYHVIARANRSEFILDTPKMKDMFLKTIARAKRKYAFTISNFCIMDNHVHLMIRPGKNESLSRIMQWILSVFATAYNRHFGIHGHVWYDRFRSYVIRTFRQWISTFSYITENPVRARMVAHAGTYNYGGLARMRKGDFSIVESPGPLLDVLFPHSHIGTLPSPTQTLQYQ